MKRIVVTSPSFSKSGPLVSELTQLSSHVKCNSDGISFTKEGLIDFCSDFKPEVLIVGLERVDNQLLDALPDLKLIAKYGVGLDNIDLDEVRRRGIKLGWTGGVNRTSVAELALCFALGHFRNVFQSISLMNNGHWVKSGGMQLSGKTFSIIGFGYVGMELARFLQPFNCRLLVVDILDKSKEAAQFGATQVSLEQALAEGDVISFHVPSTPLTLGFYGSPQIQQTKPGALVINTSRGDIIRFDEVIQAVESNRLGGFATDVFPAEPFDASSLSHMNRIYCTPHIGGNAKEAVYEMGMAAISHVRSHFMSANSLNS